jgi:hypothetical protein
LNYTENLIENPLFCPLLDFSTKDFAPLAIAVGTGNKPLAARYFEFILKREDKNFAFEHIVNNIHFFK